VSGNGPVLVSGLSVTPVKSTRLKTVQTVQLGHAGALEDRRFFLIDDGERMINGKQLGGLNAIVADYSSAQRRLALAFPDGSRAQGTVSLGGTVTARFYSLSVEARLVDGPWSDAVSEYAGRRLRLVEAGGSVDRGPRGAATLISRASLARLAEVAGEPNVDARRFRMLIEVDGVAAHAEDAWVGRAVRIGDAVVRFNGHVGRCLTTSRDPDTGEVDLPTLDVLRSYRGELQRTEPLPFGIYGEVLEEGAVRVGDRVLPEE
jgi:MOSC domain-containing protein